MSFGWNSSFSNLTGDFTNGSRMASKGTAIGTASLNAVTVVLFTAIIITGTVGSCLVIATVIRWRKFRTPCNYLLMNIAIADLCVALVASPLRIMVKFISWPFGEFMCHVLAPLVDVFICVSVVTHTAIAIERYRAIVTPFKEKISLRKTKIVIVGTWLACYLMIGLPIAFHAKLYATGELLLCVMYVPRAFRHTYEIYLIVAFIVLPLVIQAWAYFGVVKATCQRNELLHSPSTANATDIQRRDLMKVRHRLVKILVVLVVIFQICYLPRGVLLLLREFGKIDRTLTLAYVNLFVMIVYYLKHVVNPIVLFAMSADFRAGFYYCLCCVKGNLFDEASASETPARQMLITSEPRKTSVVLTRLSVV